jgi:diguanylate cyclase (GGDEF)-like protein
VILAVFLMLLERISAAAIQALDQALVLINDLAIRDESTGVFNRREIIRLAEMERSRAERQKTGFCLCLLDIDHFKNINDEYGHMAGDMVLKAVSNCVQLEIRKMDFFGRYGGEEFLLLLIEVDESTAFSITDRLRQAIAALPLPVVPAGRQVTVSVGVAQFKRPETIAQALSRADRALYASKRGGRNRVMVAEGVSRSEIGSV